jgi:hypothetical protein
MPAIEDILSTTKRQSLLDRITGEYGKNKKVRKEEAKRGHRLLNQMTSQSQMMFSIVNNNSTLFNNIAENNEEVAEALQIIADPGLKAIQQKILDREAITEKQALFLTESMEKATKALSETDAEMNVSLQSLTENSKQQLLNENIDKEDRRAMLDNMVEFMKGQGVQSAAFARIEALQEEGINFEDGAAQDSMRLQDALDLLAQDAQGKELVTTMKDLNKDFSESVLLQEEFQEMMGEEFADGNTFREKLLKNASAFSMGAGGEGITTAIMSMIPGGALLAPLIAGKMGKAFGSIGKTLKNALGFGGPGGVGKGGAGKGGMGAIGKAGLVAGAALAGWKIGSMIEEAYGDEIGGAVDSIMGFFGKGAKAIEEAGIKQKEGSLGASLLEETAASLGKDIKDVTTEEINKFARAKRERLSAEMGLEAVEVTPPVAEVKPKEVTPTVTGKEAQIEKGQADVAMAKVAAQPTVSTPGASSMPQGGGTAVERRLKVDDTQLAMLKTLMI